MNKLERLETKILLSKIRNILLSERIKGYYRNEMNITEIIPLSSENQKLVIYKNNMTDIVEVNTKPLTKEKKIKS